MTSASIQGERRQWLSPFSHLLHFRVAVSTIADGNLSLRYGSRDRALANRTAWWESLAVASSSVLPLSLDVSYGVRWLDGNAKRGGPQPGPETDGAWIDADGRALFMVVADCFPVACYDPARQALGLFHAGRHDLGAGLLERFLELGVEHGVDYARTYAFIGPGICDEHYAFHSAPAGYARVLVKGDDGMVRVDLRRDIHDSLVRAGVRTDHIAEDPRCTYEADELFSHRKSQGGGEQRFGFIAYA